MMLFVLPFTLWLAWFLYTAVLLFVSYLKVRELGLPIIINPIHTFNPFWALTHRWFLSYLRRLPPSLFVYFRYSYVGWPFDDRYRTHEELGPAFVLVGPGQVEIFVADNLAIEDIACRRKDFQKPALFYDSMNLFGKNVDTVDGEDWQRHRKITSPPFNERNSSLVWKESIRQAQDMLANWTARDDRGVNTTTGDTMTLALHVITHAGFGKTYSFNPDSQDIPQGHSMSYRDALGIVLKRIIILFIFPHSFLQAPFLPQSLRRVGQGVKEFNQYMREMMAHERTQLTQPNSSTRGNLMSALIRASDAERKGQALTDDEIRGNTFIYSMAGHETTANTLAYALTLLSVHPEWQDWIYEELTRVLPPPSTPPSDTPEAWDYTTTYPRLKRCQALMYETLRLYSPLTAIPKYTNEVAQPLTIASKPYIIPTHTILELNSSAVHTLPEYWGSDSLSWKPSRWISSSLDPSTSNNNTTNPPLQTQPQQEEETLIDPPFGKGTFLAWSEGPRICPGKKFSQVEFVAVIASLFREWRVRVKLGQGETVEEARRRVLGVVEDSVVTITLQMRRAEGVGLVWERRG